MSYKYRRDIDGLRAVAIVPVVLFHAESTMLSGGYIGVDIFFVISGYLITSLIYKEIEEGSFTFLGFYKRRAARLLPALSILLFSVLLFGGVFYNGQAYDNLGKEVFFSSIGAANILFAQGLNYFAQGDHYRPLLHIWSLGVEEQFYLFWPAILCVAIYASKKIVLPTAIVAFSISLLLSINAVEGGLTEGYFLLQYRAFELLVGAITSLLMLRGVAANYTEGTKQVLSVVGMLLMIVPMFLMDKQTPFPGYNALWPCLGAALVIAVPNNGIISRLLSNKVLVFIGLISYPLYLYHQPVISFIKFFDLQVSSVQKILLVAVITTVASWLTYRFVELPIRKRANSKKRKKAFLTVGLLVASIPLYASAGLIIAKTGGLQERFQYLNPYAFEIRKAHIGSFALKFERGYKVSPEKESKVLFIGDSVLQHYIYPVQQALSVSSDEIDTVTRGACVLLKGAEYVEKFNDVSCDDLRSKLFESEKTYDYVVISQRWAGYTDSVTNFPASNNEFDRWQIFLNSTIEHFLTKSQYVIVIGAHPKINGTNRIQPSLTTTKASYREGMGNLQIDNMNGFENSIEFFNIYRNNPRVGVVDPHSIFCQDACVLSSNEFSYFYDQLHLSNSANEFVSQRLKPLIENEFD